MDDAKKTNDDQFDAALPLPLDDKHKTAKIDHEASHKTAADLIRKKVEAAYKSEPPAAAETMDIKRLGDSIERSKHQQFIYELTSSGKSLSEIQAAWHDYYAALTEAEKHEVWQEFYNTHGQAGYKLVTKAAAGQSHSMPRHPHKPVKAPAMPLRQLRHTVDKHLSTKAREKPSPLKSIAFGLTMGAIVLAVFMFGFFNERFIAPFIQPSRNVSNTPIITGSAVSSTPEIIIPKINVEIPVVYGVDTISESAVETALEQGVVHYADTANPGQNGNVVIVGHSSNNIFNPGKYKFAFVLLSRLENDDTFYLQKDGKRYTYQVYKKEIVNPTSVDVLGPQDQPATASLITCDPPGTSTNRLVVVGTQIDPSPSANAASTTTNHLATSTSVIPGNSPSLWSRLIKWLGE